jgi:hypothetical protein
MAAGFVTRNSEALQRRFICGGPTARRRAEASTGFFQSKALLANGLSRQFAGHGENWIGQMAESLQMK